MSNLWRTVFFFSWMWFVLFLTILLLIPLPFMNAFSIERIKSRYIRFITGVWASHLIFTSGSTVEVSGLENLPGDKPFCLIANHSSNFDIPLLISALPRTMGFVGKKEMKAIPFLNSWMKALNSVFIDRKDLKDSIRGLRQAVDHMKKGFPMALFPEGTRTKTGTPGTFHKAGLKLVHREGIPFLPVSIINSWAMFEKQNRIVPQKVKIIIHPLNSQIDKTVSLVLKGLDQ